MSSSTRTRPTSSQPTSSSSSSSSSSRSPLESLIYAAIPSLSPRRSTSTSISPSEEDERKTLVNQLIQSCETILKSRVPSSAPLAAATLVEEAKFLLMSPSGDAERALRFGGLWNKLEKSRTLASPNPHLQFLLALSSYPPPYSSKSHRSTSGSGTSTTTLFNSTHGASNSATITATPVSSSSSSRRPLNEGRAANIPTPPLLPPTLPSFSAKGKSKAQLLKSWRISQSQPPFPEHLLLRDTLYLLQGIDGRYVRFAVRPQREQNPYLAETDAAGFPLNKEEEQDDEEDGQVVGINIVADESKDGIISSPTRTLLAEISEMGVLYRRVTEFVKKNAAKGGGMVVQSLCHFLHHELSEYHRLLAVLESQLSLDPEESTKIESSSLTLLRLGLWTEEMRLKLRLMNTIVDDARSTHGGALVSKIHSHTSHGDPLVRKFTDQILEEVSKPFFSTLQRWIFTGDLHDPFKEFFVQLNPEAGGLDGRISPHHDAGFEYGFDQGSSLDDAGLVWEKKYIFVKAMVPSFVGEDFGKKIFSTGRSLNFIRYNCYDNEWISTQSKLSKALKYSDLAGLERSIDDAFSVASKRLLEIFFEKYRLLDHLRALKSYLMLGAGDFTELLMEALAPRLSKPAISLYRHHLTSDLESAIRGSNAQFDSPDILRRLDARILEYTHGELGWDCFALEYRVEAPLNAVLDAKSMDGYDRLFHHLWRLKRVETTLTSGWMRVTSGSRIFERLPDLDNDWHHCRVVQAEMVHFLRQMQAFIQLEVIECSWQSLLEFTDKRDGDLDALIQAHRTYLDRVVKKALLLNVKRDREEILLELVREAQDYILQFRAATDDLYGWSLAEATRLDRERDTERGLYSGPNEVDDPHKAREKLDIIRERVRDCSNQFQDRVIMLCKEAGSHADLDIRFLAIRIAFNGHYALRRGTKKSTATNTGTAAGAGAGTRAAGVVTG